MGTPLQPPPLFELKIGYSYVIEVADSEYQLLFHRKFFLTFIVYYVHAGSEGVFRVFTFEGVCRVFTFEGVFKVFSFKGVCRVYTLRVYVGYLR